MSRGNKAVKLLAVGYIVGMLAQKKLESKKNLPIIDKKNKCDIDNVLILGSGGVLGLAWHAATLRRLERLGLWNPEEDDLRIGTSAGSMVAMALGAGLTPEKILKIVSGELVPHNDSDLQMPKVPVNVQIGKGRSNRWYLLKAISKARFPYPGLFISSLFPHGEATMDELLDIVNRITDGNWPKTETWVTSAEINKGARHVFDRNSGITPGFAVAASCSIPSVYRPMQHIEDKQFVDGGVISGLHIDLAIRLKPKKIIILAPLSGFVKLDFSDPWNVSVKKIARNGQELAIAMAKAKAKRNGTELIVLRPRPIENELLNRGSLMDSTLLPELIEATLKD